MNRKFGIEMEIIGITRETAIRALSAVNINVVSEDYNHVTRPHWKLVSDSSVRNGFEVVSPILIGEEGIAEAEIVARALDDAGASVNATCGFHVHFDAADLNAETVKNILRRYTKFEAEIDAFMPRSRRGDDNQYCRSFGRWLRRLDETRSIEEIAGLFPGRYHKVNLEAISRHGTIEFRQHSGTVNAAKISNWIRFLGGFIDYCKYLAGNHAPVVVLPELSGVQKRLAGMLKNAGPVTLDRIMAEFGWRDISARAAITRLRKAGMDISATRLDGKAAYMFNGACGTRLSEQADSLWNGIEPQVAGFFQRRAAVLAVAV